MIFIYTLEVTAHIKTVDGSPDLDSGSLQRQVPVGGIYDQW